MDYELQSILKRIVRRLLLALPLIVLARYFFSYISIENAAALENPAEAHANTYNIILFPFLAIACLAAAGFVLAPPLAELFAHPLAKLFYPTDSAEKPPPLYSVPEWLLKENRIEEAILEYEKIVHYHPQELNAHLALIRIYQDLKPDREKEIKVYQRALKSLRRAQDRNIISETKRINIVE